MELPNLATLSLAPPEVAEVGASGKQCNPYSKATGYCVLIVPTPHMFELAQGKLDEGVTPKTTTLAFRINPRHTRWRTDTPYDTLYRSQQGAALAAILGGIPSLVLAYKTGNVWKTIRPTDGSWEDLTTNGIIRFERSTVKERKFGMRLRFELPPAFGALFSARVLNALHKYNQKHAPLWALQAEEKRKAQAQAASTSAPAAAKPKRQPAPSPSPPPSPEPPLEPPPESGESPPPDNEPDYERPQSPSPRPPPDDSLWNDLPELWDEDMLGPEAYEDFIHELKRAPSFTV